jgi:hypothetical protein
MSDNRSLESDFEKADYNSLVAAINQEYCKKHNYDFVYYVPYLQDKDNNSLYNCLDPHSKKSRHASWSKILSTKRALNEGYDYVVYIDSDCIFRNDNVLIEDIILPRRDKSMIFLNDKPYHYTRPCAGFYICKSNAMTKQFVHDWYDVDMPERNTQHAWEQAGLISLLCDKRHPFITEIVIIDSWMFEEDKDQFLRHISSVNKNIQRIPFFKEYILSKNIDFENNIKNVKTIYFDTA